MPKNYCAYKDVEVKRFNHVTVVKGNSYLKDSTVEAIEKNLNKVMDASYIVYQKETTGRSKCDPEDKYDAKTGLIVASRKAELKGTSSILKDITKLRKETESFLELLKAIEDKLDYKVGKLNLDLVKINRGIK